jgi:long-chain fatty acid transport protein
MRTVIRSLALLALLVPAVALANGYDVPNTNPRDIAMAGSGVAAQGDASATYGNAAALSRLGPGLRLAVAGSGLFLTTKWNDTSGALSPASAKTKMHPVPPVSIFGSYGFKLAGYDAAVGLGMNVPAGGNVFWPDDWAGRGRIITVDRKIYGGYLMGSLALSQWVRVGAGAVYYYGTEYLKQGIQPDGVSYGELSTKGGALSAGASLEITPSDTVRIGADYKYLGTMKLKGDGHFVVPHALQTQVLDQGVRHDLTYPSVLNLGVAVRAVPSVLVTLAFTYNWYEVYKNDQFIGDKGTNIVVDRHYGNGQTYRIGAEWDALPMLQVRAGVLRDLSGLKTDFYSATLPDANTWAYTAGVGVPVMPNLEVNLSAFYTAFDKVTVTGTNELPGTYKTTVFIGTLGVTWRADAAGGGK